jgi:hypothetical protein
MLFEDIDNQKKALRQAQKLYLDTLNGSNDDPPKIGALEGETLLGAIWGDLSYHPDFGDITEVSIAVTPKHQGKGIGKNMLMKFVSMKRDTIIARPMNDASKALLRSAGFIESEKNDEYWIYAPVAETNLENCIRIFRGLEQKFDSQYDISKSDAPHGYSTWTDSLVLARQYAGKHGYIYYLDLPLSEMGKSAIDENPKSENYGDRVLFYFNEKPAGLNGVTGKEILVYTFHELYDPNRIKEFKFS